MVAQTKWEQMRLRLISEESTDTPFFFFSGFANKWDMDVGNNCEKQERKVETGTKEGDEGGQGTH